MSFRLFVGALVIGIVFFVANYLAESFLRAQGGEEAVKRGREAMKEVFISKSFIIPVLLLSLAVFLGVWAIQGHW